MIKIENTEVFGWEAAIRGMRNPMNSHDKSDSFKCHGVGTRCESCNAKLKDEYGSTYCTRNLEYVIGKSDFALMKKLVSAGSDHSKFMRMINVTLDITAPMYWWAEADTYKVGTVRNSCSKMHKMLCKPFEMSDFSFDQLSGYKNEITQFRPKIDEEMEEKEIWVTYDRDYDISNYGRVRHKYYGKFGSISHYRIISGSLHKDGYIFATLHGKQYPVHRLIAKFFHCETYSEGLVVNHKDGNKQNNFVDNIEWVTQKENIKHSHENNLQPRKVATYTGKFTSEQREEIKALWDNGELSRRQISNMYGVSHTCINNIINDKYKYAGKVNLYEEVARPIVDTLNEMRDSWLECDSEEERKTIWYSILQLLPVSYNQRATIQLNYQVLRSMYHARKNHKLDEWRELCKWIETLPYSELITDKGESHE